MQRYEQAARAYLEAFRATVVTEAPFEETHANAVRLAERLLPTTPDEGTP